LSSRAASGIILALLLIVTLNSAFSIQPVKTEPTPIMVPDDYPTIQEAINHANEGDTIFVRNGTYSERIIVNKTVSLIGENRNTTIIDGNKTETLVNVTADNVTISGFTVQNGEIGIDLNSNSNTVASNIISSNGAQETDLKTNLEIYPEPPSVPIWRFLYDLINSSYTEFLDLTTDTPILEVEVLGHSDVAELALGLFYDKNMDGIPQLNEYAGFGSRAQVTGVALPNPAKGRYIIKVQGRNVLGNPGHFDRKITKYKGYGIGAHASSNDTFSQNLITENYAGLYLQSCSNITVHNSNVTGNLGAIIVGDLIDSTFYDNEAFDNTFAICMRSVTNANLTDNVLSSNIFGIHIWNSSGISITENDFYTHGGWAIGLISSVDNKVANNNISTVNGLDGIRLMFSSRNNLTGNNMSHCEHSGILLWYDCYNNSATDNYIGFSGSHGWGDGHGIEVLLSHNNVFANNVAAFNSRNQGMLAIESSNNNFTGNLVHSNRKGIQLRSSFGNQVYHNSIIDNLEQGLDDTGGNFWDNGYPLGGNYWSDNAKTDSYRGPDQNEPGSDGICDVPYTVDGSKDNYPLTKPYAGSHDIGIRASFSKTVFPENYNTTIAINVTLINFGEQTETFNFTFQNDTAVLQQTLTLESRNSTTLTFKWNSTGLPKGNYTINISVSSVPSETDTADNIYVTRIVITILGDVNGDFRVEGKDNGAVAKSYDTVPGDLLWNPNADINDDGRVEGKDVGIVAKYYDTRYP